MDLEARSPCVTCPNLLPFSDPGSKMPYLFAYGTLAPRDALAAIREGWVEDEVRGRLYDLGPYPALVDVDVPSAGWVHGYVRIVAQQDLDEALDRYEGVEEGLYRRMVVGTRGGRLAWVYVYARPLPPEARGPVDSWSGVNRVKFAFSDVEEGEP